MVSRENFHIVQRFLTHLAEVEQLQPKTLANKRVHLRHLLEWADERSFAQAPSIRPTLPRYLLTARDDGAGNPLSREHMAKICGAARHFFTWLKLEEPGRCRAITPAWIATLEPVRRPGDDVPAERDIYTLEDIRTMVALPAEKLTERRVQAGVALLFLSGMRIGAFVTLHIDCVDIERRTIKQWPSLGVHTKGSKTATTYLLEVPDLLAVVQAWDSYIRALAPRSGLWYPALQRDGAAVDVTSTSHPNRRAQFDVELRAFCERAGVPYRSAHKLRHGHAVYALKQAQSLADYKAVSQNMMHASLQTTDAVYAVLTPDDVGARIGNLGKGPAPDELARPLVDDAVLDLLAAKLSEKLQGRLK